MRISRYTPVLKSVIDIVQDNTVVNLRLNALMSGDGLKLSDRELNRFGAAPVRVRSPNFDFVRDILNVRLRR